MNPNFKSVDEVNMQVGSSSAKFNTDGRTDKRTKNLPTFPTSSPICNAREDDEIAALGEVIEGGLWPTGQRHPVIRTGERAEIPKHTRAAVWFRDKGRCRLCGPDKRIEGPWHLDHIKPWSAGGSDTSDNLRVLCEFHNMQRGNQRISEERPESLVTWWCSRCFMLDEHPWEYIPFPVCPVHNSGGGTWADINPRCRVQRAYKSTWTQTGEWPTWHKRAGLVDLHTTAYCAHCNMRGLTGATL